MGSFFRKKPTKPAPASREELEDRELLADRSGLDAALDVLEGLLDEVKSKSSEQLETELEATREAAASKGLRDYLLEYLSQADPAGNIVLATASSLGSDVSGRQLCLHLTGLLLWARCYNWRYLYPEMTDRKIADEVEAAVAAIPQKGEGPGPALRKLATQLRQQGHQIVDLGVLKGTGREVRRPDAPHAQLAALLNYAVYELDNVVGEACPGPRVSLTRVSPVRASALYLAFVRMYEMDPSGGNPAMQLAARAYFEQLGEAVHGAALSMDLDRGRYQG